MKFVKVEMYNGKTIIINTDMITQVVPHEADANMIRVYLAANDTDEQDFAAVKGTIDKFFKLLQ